jgi:hypothetical protein
MSRPQSHRTVPVGERTDIRMLLFYVHVALWGLILATDIDVQNYPPAQRQMSQGHSNFSDSSSPLFSMYLRVAKEEDQSTAELLKADTDQILIFVSPCIGLLPCHIVG